MDPQIRAPLLDAAGREAAMRERLESLLLVLAVGSSVAIGAKRVGVPYNVALVIVGLLLVLTDVLPNAAMDPEMILIAFLPILVFEGAFFADADNLRRASRPILALAVPGVAISLLGTAAVATFVLGLPFPIALLLGALLSITDTVSVLLAFRSVRVPHRLAAIMEGESLFNDGTALVLVTLASHVVTSGRFDAVDTLRALGLAMLGGAALGGAFGAVGAVILRRAPDHLTAILASAVLVFATSLVAERLHASPVIAVVVAGVYVGKAARHALGPSHVMAMQGFWESAGFGLNVLIFLLVGMQIQARTLLAEAGSIVLALVALHAGRAIAVYGCFGALRAGTREVIPMRWQHVMVVGNIKGALSMAAVLTLPSGFPYRDRLVTIVFGVTFVTLMTQALPFGRLLKLLRVTEAAADPSFEAAKMTLVAARRGQAELDDLLTAGLVSRREHAERRAIFQRRVIDAEAALRDHQREAARDHVVEVSLLNAEKAAVLDAARRGLISQDTASAHANEIDGALLKLSTHGGGGGET